MCDKNDKIGINFHLSDDRINRKVSVVVITMLWIIIVIFGLPASNFLSQLNTNTCPILQNSRHFFVHDYELNKGNRNKKQIKYNVSVAIQITFHSSVETLF